MMSLGRELVVRRAGIRHIGDEETTIAVGNAALRSPGQTIPARTDSRVCRVLTPSFGFSDSLSRCAICSSLGASLSLTCEGFSRAEAHDVERDRLPGLVQADDPLQRADAVYRLAIGARR